MDRRSLLVGVGGLVAGGGALLGTGAFTTVTAERTVNVETAGDANAFLGIEPFETDDEESDNAAEYVDTSGETVVIDITGTDEGATGVNENAITALDRLLKVTNNGTQTVQVGFNDPYAREGDEYDNDVSSGPPGGWGYAVPADESAAVVVWACPLPEDIDDKTLEEVRPDLSTTGFGGSGLVDGSNDHEVEDKTEREIAPGESLHMGAIVDTRDSTVNESNISDQDLTQSVRVFADVPDTDSTT